MASNCAKFVTMKYFINHTIVIGLLAIILFSSISNSACAKPTTKKIQYLISTVIYFEFSRMRGTPLQEFDSLEFTYDSVEVTNALKAGNSISIHPDKAKRGCFMEIDPEGDTQFHGSGLVFWFNDTLPLPAWTLIFTDSQTHLIIPSSKHNYFFYVVRLDSNLQIISYLPNMIGTATLPGGDILIRFSDSGVVAVKSNIIAGSLNDNWHWQILREYSDIIFYPIISSSVFIPSKEGANLMGTGFPNPFTTHTTIGFTLTKPEAVKLQLFDITGRTLREADRECTVGTNEIELDTRDLPPGCYWYLLHGGEWERSGKVVKIEP